MKASSVNSTASPCSFFLVSRENARKKMIIVGICLKIVLNMSNLFYECGWVGMHVHYINVPFKSSLVTCVLNGGLFSNIFHCALLAIRLLGFFLRR